MIKLLVKSILEKATHYDWTLQGFGMLRMYLAPEVRLQVWDQRFAVPDVSNIHTHPWDFKSTIIAGELRNYNYNDTPGHLMGKRMFKTTILTGEQAQPLSDPEETWLVLRSYSDYKETHTYHQYMEVPHLTCAVAGTTTVIERTNRTQANHALSYWEHFYGPDGWVSAAPRVATEKEVLEITQNALRTWFQ